MKIGLMLPIGQEELLREPGSWRVFRDMALAAEEGGLDSVWCADHVLFRSPDEEGTWGVATAHPRVVAASSGGTVRGGAVSGLGGFAAARHLLDRR